MSATTIPLLEFVGALGERVKHYGERIHPSGRKVIHEWMVDALCAAHEGDAHEVKRLTGMVQHKLRLERLWRVQSWLTAPQCIIPIPAP